MARCYNHDLDQAAFTAGQKVKIKSGFFAGTTGFVNGFRCEPRWKLEKYRKVFWYVRSDKIDNYSKTHYFSTEMLEAAGE